VQAVQRRAVQQEQRADGLDLALKQVRVAKASITTSIPAVTLMGEALEPPTVERVGGTEGRVPDTLRFAFRQEPFTIGALVLPMRAPQRSWMHVEVVTDPVVQRIRVGCGPPNRANNGIRPVALTIEAPRWAKVAIDSVEVAPEACNPTRRSWLRDWRTLTVLGLFGVSQVVHE
jgi:hypothetical protein